MVQGWGGSDGRTDRTVNVGLWVDVVWGGGLALVLPSGLNLSNPFCSPRTDRPQGVLWSASTHLQTHESAVIRYVCLVFMYTVPCMYCSTAVIVDHG